MTDHDAPLAGKVAYVTGAARGQGRSHCIRLARAGADIVAIDACAPVTAHNGRPPARPQDLAETVNLVEGEGRKILADEVDVRDAAGQQRVVADALQQFGRPTSSSLMPVCYIHSFSPGALLTDSLADPDLISDIVPWLASDASSLVTAAQIPADKGYLKI